MPHHLGYFHEERDATAAVRAVREAAAEGDGRLQEHLAVLAEQRAELGGVARLACPVQGGELAPA